MEPKIVLNTANFAEYSYIVPYIRYCNEDRYSNPWVLNKRTIQDYEFILIIEGKGKFIIENREYSVKPDDLLLISPEAWHEGLSVTKNFAFLCMHFDIFISPSINIIRFANPFILETVPSDPVRYYKANVELPEYVQCDSTAYLQNIFRRLVKESKDFKTGYNSMLKSLFIELLIGLCRQLNSTREVTEFPPAIESAVKYIRDKLGKKITLAEISDHVHLQSSYFSALFKKYLGVPFSEYLKLMRLAEAKDMLLNTDRKVEDIALSTGFYDIHHFCNIFKKYEGLTPTQYSQIKYGKKM